MTIVIAVSTFAVSLFTLEVVKGTNV